MAKPALGSIGWIDLTIDNAPQIRDFYCGVAGWEAQSVSVRNYEDFTMHAAGGQAVAGICHARGDNKGLPAAWLIYIVVENLDLSLKRCKELGGEIVSPVHLTGGSRYAVIKDPAGVVAALWEPAEAA